MGEICTAKRVGQEDGLDLVMGEALNDLVEGELELAAVNKWQRRRIATLPLLD